MMRIGMMGMMIVKVWIVDFDGAKLSPKFLAIKWSKKGHKSRFWTKNTRFFAEFFLSETGGGNPPL